MNLDTALRICGPAMIAMMIFAVSPGRYGITPTPSPATKLIPSWPASHAVPNACLLYTSDVSDIHAVNDAVKNADKLRQHTGDRDADHKFFYIVTAEIIFCCHNYLLMIYSRSKTGCV